MKRGQTSNKSLPNYSQISYANEKKFHMKKREKRLKFQMKRGEKVGVSCENEKKRSTFHLKRGENVE